MHYSKIIGVITFAAGAYAACAESANSIDKKATSSATNSGDDSTTLLSTVIQKGSTASGNGAVGSEAGQALSATSNSNFINFCSGKSLTNGLQITTGSCNGIRKYK